MKRGPVIAASQSLRLIIQSVWRNVNKSELSLSLSICSFLSSSFVRRGEDYALRRTFGTQSITRALALPKFAEEKYLADRDPCGRGRAHVGEETERGIADSIWQKVTLSLALSLDISPRDLSLSHQEDVSAGDGYPSEPRGHRVLRPGHCPSVLLPAGSRPTTIRAIATKFLRPSFPPGSPLSLSVSLSLALSLFLNSEDILLL